MPIYFLRTIQKHMDWLKQASLQLHLNIKHNKEDGIFF